MLANRKEYNILLLGQTDAGKSMLINSFCNYVHFNDLPETSGALTVDYSVSTSFPWSDLDDNVRMISIGPKEDENESHKMVPLTQNVCRRISIHIRVQNYCSEID